MKSRNKLSTLAAALSVAALTGLPSCEQGKVSQESPGPDSISEADNKPQSLPSKIELAELTERPAYDIEEKIEAVMLKALEVPEPAAPTPAAR